MRRRAAGISTRHGPSPVTRSRRLPATCAPIRSSPSTSTTGTSPAASSTRAGTRSQNRRRCPSSWRDCRQAPATGTFARPSAH
jgi:hypothetical protein